jgi:hypothetical protein
MTPSKKTMVLAPDLQDILGLLKGADSTELKLTVPEEQRYRTLEALGIDPLEARLRQVFFFDTPELTLDDAGVVVRARRIQDASADTAVKLRPVAPDQIGSDLRRDPAFTIEVDAMPGGYVCSGSLKGRSTNEEVLQVATGTRSIRKLFSKTQRTFFATHAPGGLELEDLSVLGPITVLKLKYVPTDIKRKMTVELWFYPDGSRILELSTKCLPAEAFDVAVASRNFLEDRGVDLRGDQQTKTKTALTYFSEQLQRADVVAAPAL